MLSYVGFFTPRYQSSEESTMKPFELPNLRNKPISILSVEKEFVIVDKPANFLSVPGRGPDMDDCVIKRIAQLFPHSNGPMSVHRLDVETSGLMVVALSRSAHRNLSMQFEKRNVEKSKHSSVEKSPRFIGSTINTFQVYLFTESRPGQAWLGADVL